MKTTLACILLITILSSCALPSNLFFDPPPLGQPTVNTPQLPTPTFTVVPTDTAQPPTAQPCAYVWVTKPLLDETAMFQEALKKANLGMVDAALNAYGENCLDTLNNTVVSFSVIQTDFYFNIPVSDIKNRDEMGNWTAKLLGVIKDFPPGKVPGSNTGLCGLTFQTLSEKSILQFSVAAGLRSLQAGLRGGELYTVLQQP